jgi:photosystem II stability/assembly factor-like uncharacterized protein
MFPSIIAATFRNALLYIILPMMLHLPSFAQSESDKASERRDFDRKILSDPGTGKIPRHIREKELAFAQTLPNDGGNSRASSLLWKQRGPWNVGGITRAFARDVSNPQIMMAGSNSGGLYRSTDAGNSWNIVTPKTEYHGITTLVQDKRPGKTNVWYYGSGDPYTSASEPGAFYAGNGLYKSTDNGLSWTLLPSTHSSTVVFDSEWEVVYGVITDHTDTADVVYAACYGAVFKSVNGGSSWTVARGNTSGAQSFYTNIDISPSGILYATLDSDGSGKGIWRSSDGVNWTNILPSNFPSTYNRIVSGIAPSNENVVYFLGNTPGFGTPDTNYLGDVEWNSLWKYTYVSGNGDGAGGIWEDLSGSLPTTGGPFDKFNCQGSYDLVVAVKPDDENAVFIGGTNLYRSTNGFADASTNKYIGGYEEGTSFPVIRSYENHHPDQHVVFFDQSNPSVMFSGCDGGVYRTDNCLADTVEWTVLNQGYITTQWYTIALDHGTPGNEVIICGAQDNGSWFTNNSNLQSPWVSPRGGDGSYCAIADGRSAYYFSIQNGKMMKANLDANGGTLNFARIDPIGGERYQFINPYLIDPNNNNLMYLAGGKYLWRNDDLSGIPMNNTWDSISTNWVQWPDSVPFTNGRISCLAVSENQPANRLVYGTDNQKVYKIDNANNGTPVAQNITGTTSPNIFPLGANVNCVAMDPDDGDRIFVIFSNYNVYSLFYSEDGGSTWNKGAGNLETSPGGSGNGPSLRWLTVVHPPAGGTLYFLGTSVGLFVTDKMNGTSTIWSQVGTDDIGRVVVSMMDYRRSDGMLVVSTQGAGIFSTLVPDTASVFAGIRNSALSAGDLQIKIQPNPVNEQAKVMIQSEAEQTMTWYISDERGRFVSMPEKKALQRGSNEISIDASRWTAGSYYLVTETKGRKQAKALIKQ